MSRGRKTAYDQHRQDAAQRSAEKSKRGRDIAEEYPAVADPERKAKAAASFEFFCKAYFPEVFVLPWSPDHLKAIDRIETAVREGGLFAYAMPRGSGKTTLAEAAVMWASLNGYRSFPVVIGSDEGAALELLESIKSELENNELLFEDYPEVCYPVRCLEGIASRCNGQLFDGKRTHMVWTASEVVYPTLPDSKASGVAIRVTGITGRIRGMKFKRPDGRNVRPDLVIVDDPQTDESAKSPTQSAERARILSGAVLGLSGPGKKISGIMPCTVIAPGDMADEILDRDRHPAWQGERTKMVYAFPTNESLWEQYAKVRAESFRNGTGGREATEFYRQHQAEMDAGAVVAWQERKNPDDLSAIQHAMNLKIDNERAFFAEYQNDPLPEESGKGDWPTAEQIAAKINGRERGEVPDEVTKLVAFIDVQKSALFWTVMGFEDDFGGHVVDYGVYPDQNRDFFSLADVRRTLMSVEKVDTLEEAVYKGLESLTASILGREWERDDGAMMKVSRCLIDANWGDSTDVIYKFCRQSVHSAIVLPSHGRYVGAAGNAFSEYKRKRGDRVGHNWRMPNVQGRRSVRYVLFDSNYWKTFVQERFAVATGGRGAFDLFGTDAQGHRLFAQHMTAEDGIPTQGRNRTLVEWKLKASRPDNHWFDCVVGCAVAASEQGVSILNSGANAPAAKPTRIKLSDLQKQKANRG